MDKLTFKMADSTESSSIRNALRSKLDRLGKKHAYSVSCVHKNLSQTQIVAVQKAASVDIDL